jgi:hypothetical protein
MNGIEGLSPYLVMLLIGFLPTEVWRVLGVVLAHGIDEGSEIVVWVRAVATGVLAGVIAKLIVFAPGVLADVPMWVRIVAMVGGFVAFLAVRRSVFAGVLAGEAVLIGGAMFYGV